MEREFTCTNCDGVFTKEETVKYSCIECTDEYCEDCAEELTGVCISCESPLSLDEDEDEEI